MNQKVIVALICGLLILVAVCGAAKDEPQTVQSNAKWEYKVVSPAILAGINSPEDVWSKAFEAMSKEGAEKLSAQVAANMNIIGDEGWELICYGKEVGLIFKRMKKQ